MSQEAYEIVALALRYWFTFLGLLIMWHSFSWLRKGRKHRKHRLEKLPDAGLIGELVVISGNNELETGMILPVPREGTIGSARICDVHLAVSGINPRQGDFRFKNGLGLMVFPARKRKIEIDGKEYTSKGEYGLMHHGSKITIGDLVLRLRLFVGLETNRALLQPLEEKSLQEYVKEYYKAHSPITDEESTVNWEIATKPYVRIPRDWEENEENFELSTAEETSLQEEGGEGFVINSYLYPEKEERKKKRFKKRKS